MPLPMNWGGLRVQPGFIVETPWSPVSVPLQIPVVLPRLPTEISQDSVEA